MILYRVDRRDFAIGDTILPRKEYLSKLNSKGIIIENYLEENRPSDKPERHKFLFLFEKLENAKKFLWKMQNGKLYKIEISGKNILHKGDMEITEKMYQENEQEILTELAIQYWSGDVLSNPTIEILVKSALVIEVISKDEEDRKKESMKRMGLPDFKK